MVDLSKPVQMREPLPPRVVASEPGAIAIRSLPEVQEQLMSPSHVIGRVARVNTSSEHQLENGFFLPAGQLREVRTGETFVVFQNARDTRIPVARAYLALEPVRIHGPAAFMMTDGADIVSLHISDVALDDDQKHDGRGETMLGACALVGIGVAVLELISRFAGDTLLGFLFKLIVIMTGGFFISLYGISVWKARGDRAKKRIKENVSDGVELFLPAVLKRAIRDGDA